MQTSEHKGKVEQGGVHYVVRNALAGRTFRDDVEGNAHLRRWLLETAGARIHGTTKEAPLARFRDIEQAAPQPLPVTPYAAPVWKHAKLHRDCRIIFEQAFYSAPHRLVGEHLWVCGADTTVTIFREYDVVAVLARALKPGDRRTIADHLPPTKLAGLQVTPVSCRAQAEHIGPATLAVVERLLATSSSSGRLSSRVRRAVPCSDSHGTSPRATTAKPSSRHCRHSVGTGIPLRVDAGFRFRLPMLR